jgi:hypothetical protein
MEYWLKRGFTLKGTNNPNTWIASRSGRHAVVTVDFWDNWNKASDWFGNIERAEAEAVELALV